MCYSENNQAELFQMYHNYLLICKRNEISYLDY